jgi:hypothetical protein
VVTVVIEQPNYIPWLGYFDLVRQADVWVWYDDVQYTKRDWRNRNRLAAGGEPVWLTIPVKTKGRFEQRICDVAIDDARPWVRRHLDTLSRFYTRAPFFGLVESLMRSALEGHPPLLADLTIALNERICALLGFTPRFVRSSRLARSGAKKQDALLELCAELGATSYLSGPAARAYIDPAAFAAAHIELRYITYDYPPYARGPHPFVPNLSIVDVLAWVGAEETARVLGA